LRRILSRYLSAPTLCAIEGNVIFLTKTSKLLGKPFDGGGMHLSNSYSCGETDRCLSHDRAAEFCSTCDIFLAELALDLLHSD
jgi:hypothetical protein